MTNYTYNLDIPDAPHNPSVDQPNMKINNNSIFNWAAVDHKGYKVNQGGYHTVVHLVDNVGNPVAVPAGADPAAGEVFNKTITEGVNTDTALFYQSGLGQLFQLTGTQAPSTSAANGYSFLPGGVRMMWGSFTTAAAATGTKTYASLGLPNFTTALSLSLTGTSSASYMNGLGISTSQINWQKDSAPANTIYFIALGK